MHATGRGRRDEAAIEVFAGRGTRGRGQLPGEDGRDHQREQNASSQIHGGNDDPSRHVTQGANVLWHNVESVFRPESSNRVRRSTERMSNESNDTAALDDVL
ncbi:hypothetical protein GCM10022267_76490 [Lentzea roselyniae]|uniref:Uncharacterized protein n=1 Tax=Lentzea roselyniae TaxID=531940 RepID=A0ABP7C3A3_9PSEU